jgi:hypothetical protein
MKYYQSNHGSMPPHPPSAASTPSYAQYSSGGSGGGGNNNGGNGNYSKTNSALMKAAAQEMFDYRPSTGPQSANGGGIGLGGAPRTSIFRTTDHSFASGDEYPSSGPVSGGHPRGDRQQGVSSYAPTYLPQTGQMFADEMLYHSRSHPVASASSASASNRYEDSFLLQNERAFQLNLNFDHKNNASFDTTIGEDIGAYLTRGQGAEN